MTSWFRSTFLAVLTVGTLACGDGPTGPQAAEIRLNLVSLSIEQLDSAQLIPSVVDAGGTLISGVPITFESTAPAVVSVSSIGVVKSLGPAGTGEIKVKGAGLTRMVPVTVAAVADSLAVAPNPVVVPQLGTLQINARLLDRAGAEIPQSTMTFLASDANLISVSSTGLVKSLGPAGVTSVTVSSAGFVALVSVAVTQVATRIAVTPPVPRVVQGRSVRLVPTVLDAVNVAMPGIPFQFTSLTPTLVSVAADGTVTSIGPLGDAIVRVAALGVSLSVDVPVPVVVFASPSGDSLQLIASPLMYAVDFVNANTVVAASYLHSARLFDLRSNTSSVISAPASYGVAVAASRNTMYFAGNGLVVEYNLTTQAVRNLLFQGQLFDIVLSADERTAYVGTNSSGVYVVDLSTMTVTRHLQDARPGVHLALSPSETKLYVSAGGEVTETDIASGAIRVISTGVAAQAMALTRDGRTLYTVSESGAISALELATQQVRIFQTPGCGGWGMAISPDDEKLVVSCSQNSRIAIFEARTGNLLRTFQNIGEPRRVSISADGFAAAIGTASGVAIIR